jgi:hypothetical protein
MVEFESGERSCGTGLCPLPKIGTIKAKSRPFVVLRLRDQDIEIDEGGRSNSRFLHRTDRQCAWGRNAVRDIGGGSPVLSAFSADSQNRDQTISASRRIRR